MAIKSEYILSIFLVGVCNSMKHLVLYNALAGHGDSEKKAKALSEFYEGEIISKQKAGVGNEFHTEPKYREYTGEELWQLEENI